MLLAGVEHHPSWRFSSLDPGRGGISGRDGSPAWAWTRHKHYTARQHAAAGLLISESPPRSRTGGPTRQDGLFCCGLAEEIRHVLGRTRVHQTHRLCILQRSRPPPIRQTRTSETRSVQAPPGVNVPRPWARPPQARRRPTSLLRAVGPAVGPRRGEPSTPTAQGDMGWNSGEAQLAQLSGGEHPH